MPRSIWQKIKIDFPEVIFTEGDTFAFLPDRTVIYEQISSTNDLKQLLHELAHYKLHHNSYSRDISLIDMERSAWEYAANNLAPTYGVDLTMEEELVQDSLDSYRHWLHARSICPNCSSVGIQSSDKNYRCLQCFNTWHNNEARNCQLRRYKNNPS